MRRLLHSAHCTWYPETFGVRLNIVSRRSAHTHLLLLRTPKVPSGQGTQHHTYLKPTAEKARTSSSRWRTLPAFKFRNSFSVNATLRTPAQSGILIASAEKEPEEETGCWKMSKTSTEKNHRAYASKVRDHLQRWTNGLCCWEGQCWKRSIIPKLRVKVSLLYQLIA